MGVQCEEHPHVPLLVGQSRDRDRRHHQGGLSLVFLALNLYHVAALWYWRM
jgi:hypothetical protein